MAAGKVVIGSKNTGMEDLIDDKKTGMLVNPYSVQHIYNSITLLLNKPGLCAEMGQAAREAVQAKSNAEALGKVTVDFYRTTIKKVSDKSYSFSQ